MIRKYSRRGSKWYPKGCYQYQGGGGGRSRVQGRHIEFRGNKEHFGESISNHGSWYCSGGSSFQGSEWYSGATKSIQGDQVVMMGDRKVQGGGGK